ncbi:phosphoesterase [uncultured Gimesia sp.]|jgi:predicted NUDIX family phosphoesterase|uniref:phosphoesterase n=1 Tax=uncultured Gimesia sp. TaxID=1678688 RepID=UPI0026172F7B|nr:phosphoesterase [uncultured Gimesia sp.]
MSDTEQQVEHVMVVPTLLFHEVGYFQGFNDRVEPYLNTLFDPNYISFRPRDTVEEDPSFKQLIPYCIFRHEGKIFYYTRGSKGGEQRLHSKRSIGIGGHISLEDEGKTGSTYREGMQREINEEVVMETKYTEQCVGLINDDETEVGKVHLGIVHIFDLELPKVLPREESIIETGFDSPEKLLQELNQFETWSQICLKGLFELA